METRAGVGKQYARVTLLNGEGSRARDISTDMARNLDEQTTRHPCAKGRKLTKLYTAAASNEETRLPVS